MDTYEEGLQYERKMDRISEQIEELMLDAMIGRCPQLVDIIFNL